MEAPRKLLQVGLSADKVGVITPLVERGELDQEQHDRVRDVFAIPGGCTLVRADLFASLGASTRPSPSWATTSTCAGGPMSPVPAWWSCPPPGPGTARS